MTESHEDIARVLLARNDRDLSQGRNALRIMIRAESAAKRACRLENREELDEPEK